eukprot:362112-Chlamydomonas_euryale.AAC.3
MRIGEERKGEVGKGAGSLRLGPGFLLAWKQQGASLVRRTTWLADARPITPRTCCAHGPPCTGPSS